MSVCTFDLLCRSCLLFVQPLLLVAVTDDTSAFVTVPTAACWDSACCDSAYWVSACWDNACWDSACWDSACWDSKQRTSVSGVLPRPMCLLG